MGRIRDAFNTAFPDGPASNPARPEKQAIRQVGRVVEDEVEGAAAGLIRASSLPQLESRPGTRVGQPGEVTAGVDRGAYAWSGSAWTRVGDLIDPALVEDIDEEVAAARQGKEDLTANLVDIATTAQSAMLSMASLGDVIRLTHVSGGGDAGTYEVNVSQAALTLGTNRTLQFVVDSPNAADNPSLTIGGTVYPLRASTGAPLLAGELRARQHLGRIAPGGTIEVLTVVRQSDVVGLPARLEAIDGKLGADLTALDALIATADVKEPPVAADTLLGRDSERGGALAIYSMDGVKAAAGLDQVDNVADADKPVSTPQQAVIDAHAVRDALIARDARLRGTDRDGRQGVVWSVADLLDRLALSVTGEGAVGVRDLQVIGDPLPARDGAEVIWSITDLLGRLGLAVLADSTLGVTGLTMMTPPRPRDGEPYAFQIADRDGRVALGVTADGAVTMAGAGVGYIPPAAFTTAYRVSNARQFSGFALATRSEWGAAYDVRNPAGIAYALIDAPSEPVEYWPVYGQSNAGSSGEDSEPAVLTALYPAVAMHYTVRAAHGASLVSESALTGLQPARDTARNTTGMVAMAAYEHACRQMTGEPSGGMIGWTAFWSGEPLPTFVRGTPCWQNLMAGSRAAVTRAGDYGRDVACHAITFVQGEAGPYVGYQADLIALADDLLPEIQTQMGLAAEPKMIVVQVNSRSEGSAATTSAVRIDQWRASLESGRIVLAGPMYQCPLLDTIHPTTIGRMLLGDLLGDVWRAVARDGDYIPLRPASATLSGAVVTLTFDVPFGDLQADTDWVPPVAHWGLAYSDDDDSTSIASAAIVGRDTIEVTLTSAPTGANPRLSYGLDAGADLAGWSRSRANLYSQSPTRSLWHALGYAVPEYVRHYCVAFEMEIV